MMNYLKNKMECVQSVGGGPSKSHKYLSVDHNHTTSEIRGLLCSRCNMYVGVVENEELLCKVQEYLKEYINA